MYTITRKLAMVCLAVVFSVLVYGCGGGDSKMAETPTPDDGTVTPMVMTHKVDMSMVTVGLVEITVGTYPIQPGEDTGDEAGDATFACPLEGSPCEVIVAADGTASSVGGMATAMNSTAGEAKLTEEHRVDNMVTPGLKTTPGGPFTIEPGESIEVGDVKIACLAGGLTCVVTVAADSITSVGGMAMVTNSVAGETKLTEVHMVETTAGLIIAEETISHAIEEGKGMDVGDVTFTCPAGGLTCVVTVNVDEGTTTVTSVGGMATATASEDGNKKLNVETTVETTFVVGYRTIAANTYTIQPGENMDVDDANFACPAGGVPCKLIVPAVDADTGVLTVTSLGGIVKVGYSTEARRTRAAIVLYGVLGRDADAGAPEIQTDMDGVTRTTDGNTTTITLTHESGEVPTLGYESEAVDPNNGWMGQTLKRSDTDDATTEVLTTPQEATVYTNIKPATQGKWKFMGTDAPALTVMAFVIDADQELTNMDGDTFTGAYIRADKTRIPGTFTCGTNCDPVTSMTNLVTRDMDLSSELDDGWTFESDNNEEEGATQDDNYMYFGYWLQSPADPNTTEDYQFAAISDGSKSFVVDGDLIGNDEEVLKATYEGGAAGRYTTRKLRFENQAEDPQSLGYHGRFTAKAKLTAIFGAHDDIEMDDQNKIQGTIRDFMDADDDTDLDFEVTLTPLAITTGGITSGGAGTATAVFGGTATSSAGKDDGTGQWSANFFGPAADTEAMEDVKNKLPGGVAGLFDAKSLRTNVVGAFAAEKQ